MENNVVVKFDRQIHGRRGRVRRCIKIQINMALSPNKVETVRDILNTCSEKLALKYENAVIQSESEVSDLD